MREFLRRLKNILVLLGWLVGSWLASTAAFAAPPPQDASKQTDPAPAKDSGRMAREEESKETRNAVARDYEFSATSRHSVPRLASDFLLDQKQIWTSPAKLRLSDTEWLVPLSGITAGLFVTAVTTRHYQTLVWEPLSGGAQACGC